jgi:integrase
MVTIYRDPRTDVYWLNYKDLDGRRRRESTGTKLRREAEILRAKRTEELFKAKALGVENVKQATPITFAHFVQDEFLPHCAPPTLKPSTYETYKILGRLTAAALGDKFLTAIGAADVQAYLDGVKTAPMSRRKCATCDKGAKHAAGERCPRAVSPGWINRQRSFLSRVFTIARKRGYVKTSPVRDTEKMREDNVRVRCLTLEEEERIVAAADPWFRPIIELAAATGMRRGEVVNLRWDDVDLRTLKIRVQHTKTHRTRYVHIRKPAEALLRSREPVQGPRGLSPFIFASAATGEPWTKGQLHHAMKRAILRSGVRDVKGAHDLRHTLGTRLYRATKDLQAVQKVLGHSVITTSARYAHVFQPDLDAAMDAIDAGRPVNIPSASPVAQDAEAR